MSPWLDGLASLSSGFNKGYFSLIYGIPIGNRRRREGMLGARGERCGYCLVVDTGYHDLGYSDTPQRTSFFLSLYVLHLAILLDRRK